MLSGLISSPAQADTTLQSCNGDGGDGFFVIVDNAVTGEYFNCIGGLVIPEGVLAINDGAFSDERGITSVTISASVTSIGESFVASGLTQFNVDPGNLTYKSIDGVLFTKNGETLLSHPAAKSGAYTVPASVTHIADKAFYKTRSLSVLNVDPGNLTYKSIDGVLFTKNGETLVRYPTLKRGAYTIPNGVTLIGARAFEFASEVSSITIPASVTEIGEYAFHGFNRWAPDMVEAIIFAADSELTTIGAFAFLGCVQITGITIPAGVTSIGVGAFMEAGSIHTVTFESGSQLTAIEPEVFRSMRSLREINIPATVKSIGASAFQDATSLSSITIPAGVTTIGESAFYGATAITSFIMPASVRFIGDNSFQQMRSLSVVYFLGDAPLTGDNPFSNAAQGAEAYVKCTADGFNTSGIPPTWHELFIKPCFTKDLFNVFYKSNGGSAVANDSFAIGGQIVTSNLPMRNGYEFLGWSAIDGGEVIDFPFNPIAPSDVTFYAKWKAVEVVKKPTTKKPTTKKPTTKKPTTKKPAVAVVKNPKTTKSVSIKVYFGANSSALSSEEKKKLLRTLAKTGSNITGGNIVGYVQQSTNSGNDKKLSVARARAVAQFLAYRGVKVPLASTGKGTLNSKPSSRIAIVVLRYVE
jgi:uncharacterized repeat protein (TIGR02543 family)